MGSLKVEDSALWEALSGSVLSSSVIEDQAKELCAAIEKGDNEKAARLISAHIDFESEITESIDNKYKSLLAKDNGSDSFLLGSSVKVSELAEVDSLEATDNEAEFLALFLNAPSNKNLNQQIEKSGLQTNLMGKGCKLRSALTIDLLQWILAAVAAKSRSPGLSKIIFDRTALLLERSCKTVIQTTTALVKLGLFKQKEIASKKKKNSEINTEVTQTDLNETQFNNKENETQFNNKENETQFNNKENETQFNNKENKSTTICTNNQKTSDEKNSDKILQPENIRPPLAPKNRWNPDASWKRSMHPLQRARAQASNFSEDPAYISEAHYTQYFPHINANAGASTLHNMVNNRVKPSTNSSHVPSTLGDSQVQGIAEVPEDFCELLPPSIRYKLLPFQMYGVFWLWNLFLRRERDGYYPQDAKDGGNWFTRSAEGKPCALLGGILSDEMGLGKTLSTISFISLLYRTGRLVVGKPPGVLILAPATILSVWIAEVVKWCPWIEVFSHYSDPMDKACAAGGIYLTTYERCSNIEQVNENQWLVVIADEGHKIRNPTARMTINVKEIAAPHSLLDLWSLVDFVSPARLGALSDFKEYLAEPIQESSKDVNKALSAAHVVQETIRPIILRRLTLDCVAKGQLVMPERMEDTLICKPTPLQAVLYRDFIEVNKVMGVNDGMALMDLMRKICNHPQLATNRFAEFSLQSFFQEPGDKVKSKKIINLETPVNISSPCSFASNHISIKLYPIDNPRMKFIKGYYDVNNAEPLFNFYSSKNIRPIYRGIRKSRPYATDMTLPDKWRDPQWMKNADFGYSEEELNIIKQEGEKCSLFISIQF